MKFLKFKKKKFKLEKDHYITVSGKKLYRIKALKSFGDVSKGEVGGYIEHEYNLSHDGNCWIYDSAKVMDDALITHNAKLYDKVLVRDTASVGGNAIIAGKAYISGDAVLSGNIHVKGNAIIRNTEITGNNRIGSCASIEREDDVICIGPIGSRNDYTTFYKTKDNGIWVRCGCFNNSINAFEKEVKKTHKDNPKIKLQYLTTIKYVRLLFGIKREEES